MRASTVVWLLLFGALLPSVPAAAQVARPTGPLPVDFVVPPIQFDEDSSAPGWQQRVLTALGSAALGAGIGFFASQIARGDWDDGPGQPQVNRPAWAAVGGSVGLAVGFSFPLGGRGPPPSARPTPSHLIITAEEIREVVALDAYEAVKVLRPQWLVTRPANIIGEPLQQSFPVYLDDFRLGDIDDLRGLSVHRIEAIRLISAATATARWGVGNSRGVIQVVTRGG